MTPNKREFWWLVILQASLCFSLSCWEATAPWAEPARYPIRFVVVLISAATVATLACHVGPALFAAKLGEHVSRFTPLLLLWLAVGYIEWVLSIFAVQSGATSQLSRLVFLAMLISAGVVKSWWKLGIIAVLPLSAGLLTCSLAVNWHGLWVRNSHFAEEPLQFDWLIVQGILVSAAPSVVTGWRIGRIQPGSRQIWLSGFLGLWLPLVCSVAIASLADQAGTNLHWVPSQFLGFEWALGGFPGWFHPAWVLTLSIWTLFLPALVSMISLRGLATLWAPQSKVRSVLVGAGLLIFAAVAFSWNSQGVHSIFSTPFHQHWACSLVILGTAAGLAVWFRDA